MHSPNRKPVFIEKIMPVTLLNEQVYYEHGGNPFKGLHRWYSRKPLSFSRASVLGSLLPADVTIEEFEYLLGLNRRVAGIQDKTTKLYKTPPSPDRIKKVQELCEQMWGTKTPTVLDAFAGGGSIPFEAARYGLNVLASDLNPVAVVTMKAAIEYPLKFGTDLQAEIDKWVKWVGDEAEKRLAPFFPSLPGEKVQAYFWAHTVVCPNCEFTVPLSPTWWVDKSPASAKKNNWCAVKPIPNHNTKQVEFEMIRGRKGQGATIQTSNGEFDPNDFITSKGGDGRCPNCGGLIEGEYIDKKLLEENFGYSLYSIAYKKGAGGLEFRLPVAEDLEGYKKASTSLDSQKENLAHLIPSEPLHQGQDTRCYNRGVRRWDQLFNSRQLLTLITYGQIIEESKPLIHENYDDPGKAQAVLTYLALAFDRCVDRNSRMGHWSSASNMSFHGALAQHSLNLIWNYYETEGSSRLWQVYSQSIQIEYSDLCSLLEKNKTYLL